MAQLVAVRGVTVWSIAATIVRQNGILVVAIALVVMIIALPGLRRRVFVGLLLCVVTLVGLRVAVYPLLGVLSGPPNMEVFSMLHDIGAVAARDDDALEPDEIELLERVAPLEQWTAEWTRFGCASVNWQWSAPFDRWTALDGLQTRVVTLWAEVSLENPRAVVANRLCVGAVGWRPDNAGQLYTVSRGIDPNSLGLVTDPMIGGLNDVGRDVLAALDRPWIQWLVWRAPPWIYAAYLVIGVTAWRRRQLPLLLPLLLLASLQLAVTALNAAQDARYMMPGLLLAVLLLPLATVDVRRTIRDGDRSDATLDTDETSPAVNPDGRTVTALSTVGASHADQPDDR